MCTFYNGYCLLCDLYQLKIQQYVCKLLGSQLGSSGSNTGEMQKRNMFASSCGVKWALAAQNTGKMHAPVVSIRRRKQICLQAPVVSIRLRILHGEIQKTNSFQGLVVKFML